MSEEQQAPLRVGIDLGTSRSAISCSSGGQFVVDSFVGWPADLVARKQNLDESLSIMPSI